MGALPARTSNPHQASRVSRVEALVPIPETGRTFRVAYTVRLSDTDATGRLRLDAIARYLQDAAIDDVQETGWGSPEHLWVLRSVRIDVLTPFLADAEVGIVTWGSSFSALAAGRRWSLSGDAGGSIEVDSVWIHLGPDARPARIGDGFDGYSQAAQGRVASTKLTLALPPIDGDRRLWPLRVTDVDRMGHVNNAAYWAAVEQRLAEVGLDPRRPLCARLDYRHPIDLGERVELAEHVEGGSYHVAFVVDSVVKAAARVDPL
jgi:acyl-ACP thioesterase